MATPDCINEIFEDTQAEVEVRGDYVYLTILSRFDEVILDVQLSADEADDLAAKLLDAVVVIDTRNVAPISTKDIDAAIASLLGTAPNPGFTPAAWDRGPPPPDGFREVGVGADGKIEGYRLDDSVDPATGRTYRKIETPNPTFSEAVDELLAANAPRAAAS